MAHQNSVLHQLVQLIPWDAFHRLVAQYGADDRQRGFTSRDHLVVMLYAQLAGIGGLRELITALQSQEVALYHLGVAPVPRSTLADANRDRPSELFIALFMQMVASFNRGQRRAMADTIYLIDASVLPLIVRHSAWARFSATTCGAKMHVIYDAGAERPVYASVSAANVNDITAAHAMPIERGATYVFDLGYYDYAWWAGLHAAGCRIVTRFKSNTTLQQPQTRPLPAGGNILSDRVGYLPARQFNNRCNPLRTQVREVQVRIATGKVLRIFSNDLEASAQEIADLYKLRWGIELFFKWVKQTLRIKKFFGGSQNAVAIQVATALIAYLQLRLAQASQRTECSPLIFARLIRINLTQRRTLDSLVPQPTHSRSRRQEPPTLSCGQNGNA